MKQIIKITPLALLALVCLFFLLFIVFEKDPSNPPSALLNKEMPKFSKLQLEEHIYSLLKNLKK